MVVVLGGILWSMELYHRDAGRSPTWAKGENVCTSMVFPEIPPLPMGLRKPQMSALFPLQLSEPKGRRRREGPMEVGWGGKPRQNMSGWIYHGPWAKLYLLSLFVNEVLLERSHCYFFTSVSTMAELSICNRDQCSSKPKILTNWLFRENVDPWTT